MLNVPNNVLSTPDRRDYLLAMMENLRVYRINFRWSLWRPPFKWNVEGIQTHLDSPSHAGRHRVRSHRPFVKPEVSRKLLFLGGVRVRLRSHQVRARDPVSVYFVPSHADPTPFLPPGPTRTNTLDQARMFWARTRWGFWIVGSIRFDDGSRLNVERRRTAEWRFPIRIFLTSASHRGL